jgi:polar amino acid transport system substrate-binding protein
MVAFSEKYEEVPAAFVARKSAAITDTGPGALVGRRLGAQEDTVYADYLLRHLAPAGATVRLYATIGEAELDLAAGNLDAILGNKVALMAWTARGDGQNCCVFAGYDLHDPAEFGAGVGIALRPDDNALRMRINSALATLLANGTYERIDRKYFPFSIY